MPLMPACDGNVAMCSDNVISSEDMGAAAAVSPNSHSHHMDNVASTLHIAHTAHRSVELTVMAGCECFLEGVLLENQLL